VLLITLSNDRIKDFPKVKLKECDWADRVTQVVEHLLGKYDILRSNPSTAKKRKSKNM
jgi:hypothetical protein